ncbi:STAS/SEC14 domain-containing protein [Mycobacterium sp. PSTR-4-N]|uniref:STAS/SEC14 domain-containing protein n=1 Tax=Mycobacterium sp. PSTR-4-N TaxID=2917745 RepID=UPI001F15715D|nr:STAS/SEC14 domain-containing protein [Mycobacterium sp. PSTR-4-N]MCG7596438.1 STAS/SEC14 domain-containing protein [Mycobacterium sp. PSTR-4-N]
MIEMLTDLPPGVAGFRVSGRLDGADLREFAPVIEQMMTTGEIRLVEVVADDYEGFGRGGLAEDLRLGLDVLMHHHSAFRRVAVVTDKDWVVHALHAFAWLVPGEVALFSVADLDAAVSWAAA